MSVQSLLRIARALEIAVVSTAVLALLYRALIYAQIGKPAGAAWGHGDVIDFLLGMLVFFLGGACATVGVLLTRHAQAPTDGTGQRAVVVGMTAFVAYYLVHPYVPVLG